MLVFVVVFYTPSSFAQKDLSEISGHSYQVRNWVPNVAPPSIYSIAQTPDGYLWLANDFGLYRFDGIHFARLNKSTDSIFKYTDCNFLYLTRDSTLLAGFGKGLILAYKNHIWKTLDSEEIFLHKTITAISEDHDGNIWVGLANNGVICYHNKSSKVYTVAEGLSDNGVNVLCPEKGKGMWVGTDKGLCLISRDHIKSYGPAEGLAHQDINALWLDSLNTLWIGCSEGHLYTLQNGKITMREDKPGLIRGCIKQITGFGKNTIAVSTEGQGVFILNTFSGKTEQLDTRKHLASNLVISLFLDSEGNLWAGTMGSGLSKIRSVPVQVLNSLNGLSGNCPMSILQTNDGNIWVGNRNGGVDRIRDGKIESLGSAIGLGENPVFSIAADKKNNIWIGSQRIFVKYDGHSAKRFNDTQGLNCTFFHTLYTAKDGRLWIGTDQGIFIMKDDKVVSVITTKEGLPNNKIFCFLEDRKGSMWVGTQEGGLARIKDGKIKTYGAKQGLQAPFIMCLHLDSLDNIWIGSSGNGLIHFNPATETFTPVAPSRLSIHIGYILEDRSGLFWFGGYDGLTAVKSSILQKALENSSNPFFMHFIPFDTAIGLSGLNLACFPGACRLKNGQLWFPGSEGAVIIKPENSMSWSSRPVPLIDSVFINSRSAANQEEYTIGAGLTRIEINYTAPSFIMPEELTFRYRLVGFDKDWDSVGRRRTAYYTNIPPGDYTFEVQVFNNLGELSPVTASVKIHVLPFFYQTWWFILICIIALISLVILIIKYRMRSFREKELEALVVARTEEIRKLNEQLEQKVTDRTAQLEAANKELEAFSYSVSHDLKGPVRRIDSITRAFIEDYFSSLDETERDFLKKINESAGSMNVLIDELLKLSRIVRQDIDKMQVNISDIAMDINQEIRKLNPERRVRLNIQEGMLEYCDPKLLRIAFQNLFDNAWKYSGKEKESVIEFKRTTRDGKTVYQIRDNGVGFEMTYYDKLFTPFQRLHSDDQFTGTGIGLATVKRIILKHGGLIWAESEPGKGTTFYFTFDSGK
ncbi:MAG: ATP-binding protein [Bacteroidetes bacterium]|nr:ATP-binding protein [Bacteroidota bacterium]